MGTLEDFINDNEKSIHHMWGDTEFDWKGLDEAIKIIEDATVKAHICAEIKEKWGVIRFYPISSFDGTLKSWFCPGVNRDFFIRTKVEDRWFFEGRNRCSKPIWKNRIYNKLVATPINYILHYLSGIDRFIGHHLVPKSVICKIQEHQWEVINDAFQRACLKFPHLVNEICADVDCYKIIKPNEIGPVDGEVIHNKYWEKINI